MYSDLQIKKKDENDIFHLTFMLTVSVLKRLIPKLIGMKLLFLIFQFLLE